MWYYPVIFVGAVVVAIIVAIVISARKEEPSPKEKVESIYEDEYKKRIEYERQHKDRVDHYISITCDLVPYNDPDYEKKVIEMAEYMARTDEEIDDEMALIADMHEGEEKIEQNPELPW